METLRTETADGVCSIVLSRAREYNTITPGAARRAGRRHRRGRRRPRRARASCCAPKAPRSAPATGSTGRPRRRPGNAARAAPDGDARRVWDSVADLALDEALRRRLHEALVRAEADHRRGAGLVHRRRHRHGAVRRPDRRRRGRALRLPAVARLGHADHRDVGLSHGTRAREALPADRRRDPRRARRPRSG